ncbi:hypothetical protein [Bacillus sp. C1]
MTFGKSSNSNVTGMKVIVPAKNGKSAYQIVIIVSILNKAELDSCFSTYNELQQLLTIA